MGWRCKRMLWNYLKQCRVIPMTFQQLSSSNDFLKFQQTFNPGHFNPVSFGHFGSFGLYVNASHVSLSSSHGSLSAQGAGLGRSGRSRRSRGHMDVRHVSVSNPRSLLQSGGCAGYNKLITHWSRKNAWTLAVNIFEEAKQQRLYDLITYNALLASKQWKQSLELLEQMHQSQMQMDIISFNSSIASCEANHWQVALYLRSALEALESNIVTQNSLMMACNKAQQWMKSLDLWDGLAEHRLDPTSISYTSVMGTCEAGARWIEALQFFKNMQLSNITHIAVHTAAISACGKGGNWEVALFLLCSMESLQIRASLISINAAIDACAIAEQWSAAMTLLMDLRRSNMQWDTITYTSLITACREWPDAISLLCEAHTKTLGQNLVLHNASISALQEKWEGSLLLLQDVTTLVLEPSINTLNSALASSSEEWQHSLQLLNEMGPLNVKAVKAGTSGGRGSPGPFSHLKPDVTSVTSVLMSFSNGDWQMAYFLLSRFLRRNFEPDLVTYNTLMNACVKGLQWERTLQILNGLLKWEVGELTPNGISPGEKSFLQAIQACNLSGEWQQALLVLEKVQCFFVYSLLCTGKSRISHTYIYIQYICVMYVCMYVM